MERARWLESSIASRYRDDGVIVLNVLDHNSSFAPPSDSDCADWKSEAALRDTVVVRELADMYQGEQSTASSYDGDYYMLLLIDRDKRVRLRWSDYWNEQELAPTIDDILAGR